MGGENVCCEREIVMQFQWLVVDDGGGVGGCCTSDGCSMAFISLKYVEKKEKPQKIRKTIRKEERKNKLITLL